jgi:hypothetical protein
LIRNRNLVFSKVTSSSKDADKYFQLPRVARASMPTASTTNEGGIAYDATNNKVIFSNGTTWGWIADVGASSSPSVSPSASTSPSVSVSPSVSPS